MKRRSDLLVAACATLGVQAVAHAQQVECGAFLEGLPAVFRALAPPEICERVSLASVSEKTLTARSNVSQPIFLPNGRSLGFADFEGPIASLHLLVWTGEVSPFDTAFLMGASGRGDWRYRTFLGNEQAAIEVLVDSAVLRTSSGKTGASWSSSPWSAIVAAAQVTPLPAMGVALISLVLTPEGKRVVGAELSAGSGLQALLQWRVLHSIQGPKTTSILTSHGYVSCLKRDGTVISDADLRNMPPVLKLLPLDLKNLETIAACE